MISSPAAGPLAVAETDRIADLLAEVSGRTAGGPKYPPLRGHEIALPSSPKRADIAPGHEPPVEVTQKSNDRASVRQMLEQANWRNAAPEPVASPAIERITVADPGPMPAPFGVLTVATLFGLVNWRNRRDDDRPVPILTPPPAPGAEFTVEAVMSNFGWE